MTQKDTHRIWGAIAGAIGGWLFGLFHIIWANGLPPHYIYSHSQNSIHSRPSLTTWMASNAIVVMVFGALFGAALGFLVVNSLTKCRHKYCGLCSLENPHFAVACQFCGGRFDGHTQVSMVCSSCEREYSSDARFCVKCAAPLEKLVVEPEGLAAAPENPLKECSACKAINIQKRVTCHKCGNPL